MSVKSTGFDSTDSNIIDFVSLLSRFPEEAASTVCISKFVNKETAEVWDILPVTVKDVARATREDKIYGKLLSSIRTGNIDTADPDLKSFLPLFNDLHIENEVICHGSRIVPPTRLQSRLLEELHMTHIGVVKMKEVARQYFWWPGITNQIENVSRSCNGCNRYRKKPAPAPLCPWPYMLAVH